MLVFKKLKGEQGDIGAKGEKGEPGGGYYDPRYGGAQGPPGNPGLPVRTTKWSLVNNRCQNIFNRSEIKRLKISSFQTWFDSHICG